MAFDENLRRRERYRTDTDYREKQKRRRRENYLKNPKAVHRNTLRWQRRNPANYLVGRAKRRAKDKGIEFDLKPSDIQVPVKCPILDLPLKWLNGPQNGNSATLDRIDRSNGYVKGNVWVISSRANLMKNDASEEELQKFADWINKGKEKYGNQTAG